jgi:nucleoside-triphosphatase
MDSRKCRLILITGKKHSGKTTFVQKLAERLKKENFSIAGFIAPSVYEGAFLLGFDLADIQNSQKNKFARRKSTTDNFEFSEEGYRFGRKILESEETRNADLIIIDEFGPMELEGQGWRKNVDSLLENQKCLLLVVREELVEKVEKLYSNLSCRTFSATEKSVEKIISLLSEQANKYG